MLCVRHTPLALLNAVQYPTVGHKMGITERRAREKDELRRKILDAAAAMFVDEGYENVSMRKIAERIEYAPNEQYDCEARATALAVAARVGLADWEFAYQSQSEERRVGKEGRSRWAP